MANPIPNLFKIPELKEKILFTLLTLFIYRIGAHITAPGLDVAALQAQFGQLQNTALGLYDLFVGGALQRATIFSMGIMPYISASIMFQLLAAVFPTVEKMQKEGEDGRKKLTQWTRYATVALAFVQGWGYAVFLESMQGAVRTPGIGFLIQTAVIMTAGAVFVMWLGEQISERGIGNGMSILIFAGIVVGLPRGVVDLIDKARTDAWGSFTAPAMALLVVLMLAVVGFIVFVERSERRIPVQYAKRVVGRKIMGGQSTHLPLRVNAGGVMPVIFASSILTLPQTAGFAFRDNRYFGGLIRALGWGEPLYTLLYAVGIIFFAYFYVSIVFNPNEVADNMRKYGGFIPGIRPGRRTADYINESLTRITLVGGLYLIIISFLPEWMIAGIHLNHLPGALGAFFERLPTWVTNGLGVSFYFGGTSLLIVVGVAMDTVTQIEAQLIMRHYEGFSPRSRIRGRRTWA